MQGAGTLETVRRAVRRVVERTPELRGDALLRRRIAESMVRVCATATGLMEEEDRLTDQIARRVRAASPSPAPAGSPAPSRVPTSAGAPAALAAEMAHPAPAAAPRGGTTLASGQAAGDLHRRTAVNSAAGVLRATRDAIDFPGFVTSLISGVFQAMTTSTIQQLQAYADLLGAVGMSTSQFADSGITTGRAMDWAAQRFSAFRVVIAEGQPPRLVVADDAEMPPEDELRAALDATEEEVSTISDDELEETLVPLVKRKLARERQAMLSTMLLMGMNRIVVDEGKIRASMELQVDARSTAEQTSAERFDTRVTTGGSASFGTGMWGASANMQATVGYVRSDEQFSREDIAVRAGLRSSVEVGFHTEPIALDRMASAGAIRRIRDGSMVPETERRLENLLPADERRTARPTFEAIPTAAPAPAPNSEEARSLRQRQDHTVGSGSGGSAGTTGSSGTTGTPRPTAPTTPSAPTTPATPTTPSTGSTPAAPTTPPGDAGDAGESGPPPGE